MSEGETLREFVARNRHLAPEEAFTAVLAQPKVQQWLGGDASRRGRLESEFRRLWEETDPSPPAAPAAARTVVVDRARPHVGPSHARADEAPAAPAPPVRTLRSRHEKFLCTSCGGYDVHSESDGETIRVRCRQCKAEYPDLLQLIPVIEVGPFELFFGRGREAYIKVAALGTLWIAVYALLKILA